MLKNIKRLINDSKKPPIIIIQGDHGPASTLGAESLSSIEFNKLDDYNGLKERFRTLNAIYSPNDIDGFDEKNFSIVNTFRLIMNNYFGLNLKILENKNFVSTYTNPYNFIEVSNIVQYD